MTKLRGGLVMLSLLVAATLIPQHKPLVQSSSASPETSLPPEPPVSSTITIPIDTTTSTIPVETTTTTAPPPTEPPTTTPPETEAPPTTKKPKQLARAASDDPPESEMVDSAGAAKAQRLGGAEPEPTGINGLPFAPEGMSGCAEMSFYRQQAGLPSRFDGIGARESGCHNSDSVHTSCCYGYWQMHKMHFSSGNVFDQQCGANSVTDVDSDTPLDKQRQACTAHLLYMMAGTSPWVATR